MAEHPGGTEKPVIRVTGSQSNYSKLSLSHRQVCDDTSLISGGRRRKVILLCSPLSSRISLTQAINLEHYPNKCVMTFPDSIRRRNGRRQCQQNPIDTGIVLKKVLKLALENGRIVCGIYPSIKLLGRNPENIMVCVLPEVETKDATVQIEHTLIQAYCRERGIKVLKVDSLKKLTAILDGGMQSFEDFSCVLVKRPTDKIDGPSLKDNNALCKSGSPGHVIPIPD